MMAKPKSITWKAGFELVMQRGDRSLLDVFLFSIFVNILMLTGPMFMMQVYDRVLSSRSIPTLLALTFLMIAIYIFMAIIDYARMRMVAMMGAKRVEYYQPYVFSSQLNPKQWNNTPKNSTAFRQLDGFASVFNSAALLGYFDVFWIPVYMGLMFFFHPLLGVASVVSAVLLIIMTLMQQAHGRKGQEQVSKITQGAFDLANEAVDGREILVAQSMSKSFEKIWVKSREEAAVSVNETARISGMYSSFSKTFRMFIQSMMLALGAYLAIKGEISGGSIIAGSILLGRALAPIEQILGQWSVVQTAANAKVYLDGLVAASTKEPKPVEYPNLSSQLDLAGLTVVDDQRKFIINQISARVLPGQALGIIGLSGSGKSTVAKAILGLVPLAAGEVKLGGVNKDHIGAEAYGKMIGYLPQEVKLFTGTIAQNIARMSENYNDNDVILAAQAANVHELILSFTDGYNTMISPNKNSLSGGQRQRVALARALYLNPLLLILDEPNSALDDVGSRALNIAIAKLKARGGTAVIMTHRPSAIEVTEQLMVIEGGRTKAYGPRDEVLKSLVKNAGEIQKTIAKNEN